MSKPSMRMAEWIHGNMSGGQFKETADDVYDVLLGNISVPRDFVQEVQYWATEYEADRGRHNAKI